MSAAPSAPLEILAPDPANVPAALTQHARWLGWRAGRKPNGRLDKIPCDARTGQGPCDSHDPQNHTTFAEVVAGYQRHGLAGLAFDPAPQVNCTAVDLDDCVDDSEPTPAAETTIRYFNSYTEFTPSGRGIRIWVRGTLPPGRRRKPGVEVYDGCGSSKQYLTVTGRRVPGTPATIEDRQAELDAFYAETFGEPETEPAPAPRPCQPVNLDNQELLAKARGARNGVAFDRLWSGDWSAYGSHSEADLALAGMLAFWTGGDAGRVDALFRQSGLYRAKWDTRRGGSTYGADTVAKACAGRTEFYTPAPEGPSLRITPPSRPPIPEQGVIGDELRAYIAHLEAENQRLAAEVEQLRRERSLLLAVQRNPKIKAERDAVVAAVFEVASEQSRGKADPEGWVKVTINGVNRDGERYGLAPTVGKSADRVSAHLDAAQQWGVLEKKLVNEPVKTVDRETGEIEEHRVKRTYLRLLDAPDKVLERLKDLDPIKENPERKPWGGVHCPDHPAAGVTEESILVERKTIKCAACRKVLKQTEARVDRPPRTPQDAGFSETVGLGLAELYQRAQGGRSQQDAGSEAAPAAEDRTPNHAAPDQRACTPYMPQDAGFGIEDAGGATCPHCGRPSPFEGSWCDACLDLDDGPPLRPSQATLPIAPGGAA